jgi:ABC-type glycerol-3-phosphate transport system substrate-binding protein
MRPFILCAIALIGMSVIAWAIRPPASIDGRTPLIWVSDDAPTRRLTIELFNQQHPTLDLRLDPDNGGMEKVIVQSLAGVGPDVFDCYSPNQLAAYVRAGIAWDVTDQLVAMGIDLKRDAWPLMQGTVFVNGRAYGVPANAAADAIWFNKSILESQNIPFPTESTLKTWDQFVALAQRLTLRDRDGRITCYGLVMEDSEWQIIVRIFGGHVFSPDGTRCTLDSPQAIRAVQLIHDLINVYHVSASPAEQDAAAQAGGWGSYALKAMVSGHSAMAVGGRWWLLTLRKDPDLRLGACKVPHIPGGHMMGGGKSTLINRNSPRREQALQVLKFMAGADYNRVINQEADAVGGFVQYATNEKLFNPKFPLEDFHPVFRAMMDEAEPEERSPFVDSSSVDHITDTQMDLVRRDAKTAAEAMRAATEQINEQIQISLKRDPALRQQYDQLTAGKAP